MGYIKSELPFLVLQDVGCGGDNICLIFVRGFTCRVKYRKEIDKLVDRVGSNGDIQD